jgi:hypothetical protein
MQLLELCKRHKPAAAIRLPALNIDSDLLLTISCLSLATGVLAGSGCALSVSAFEAALLAERDEKQARPSTLINEPAMMQPNACVQQDQPLGSFTNRTSVVDGRCRSRTSLVEVSCVC